MCGNGKMGYAMLHRRSVSLCRHALLRFTCFTIALIRKALMAMMNEQDSGKTRGHGEVVGCQCFCILYLNMLLRVLLAAEVSAAQRP